VRWAPLAAFAAFVALAAAWLAQGAGAPLRKLPAGSSLERGPEGASLARAYLEATGARPQMLSVPLAQAALSPGTVLLRLDVGELRNELAWSASLDRHPDAGPAGSPKGLTAAEESFVRNGGRLVLAIRGQVDGKSSSSGAQVDPPRKVAPLLPGVRDLRPELRRTLPDAALVDAQPIFEHGEAPSIARQPVGTGEIYWLAQPELLLNARLGQADHLRLLLALCADRVPVFDEAIHDLGGQTGILDLLRRWGLGPALLVGALAAAAGFWRGSRTIGPPADPHTDPRSESVELLESLAALYRRTLEPADAVDLYHRQVAREIALTLAVPEKRAEAILSERAPELATARSVRERLAALVTACERFRHEHRRRS
jgi:hypothetical protein